MPLCPRALAMVGVLATTLVGMCTAATAQPPHIVVALVDDLGWNGLNFTGHNDEVVTPRTAALARDGVMLTAHYTYRFCSPTRASLMSGRVPGHGVWETNPSFTGEEGVDLSLTLMPAMLKKAGYYTAHVGKWHLGFFSAAYTPRGRGFDSSLAFLGGGEDHLTQCHGCENSIPPPDWADKPFPCPASYDPCHVTCPDGGGVDLYRDDHPAVGENGTLPNPLLYAKEVARVIAAAKAAPGSPPFFLYLALHDVHQPVESPMQFVELYPASDYNSTTIARRIYNGMHSAADFTIGATVDALTGAGMWDTTVLIVAGDNGGTFEHGFPVPGSSNYPLRGHKYSFFEGGCRVATFVASPLLPAAVRGTTYTGLVGVYDWYATFAALANVHVTDPDTDSVDVWPCITGSSAGVPCRHELLIAVGGGHFAGAYRNGSLKLIMPGGNDAAADGWSAQYPGTSPVVKPSDVPAAARCGVGTSDPPCLFDLDADPNEHVNLALTEPLLLARMQARYRELASRNVSVRPGVSRRQPNSNCTLAGTWVIGDTNGTVEFAVSPGGIVSMTVLYCGNCMFTKGEGNATATTITLVASGKGVWIRESGDISPDGCTITWVGHNTSHIGSWPAFTKQGHSPAPPPPPSGGICAKMLETGHYAPWV